jgi:hypothetical protein
MVTPLGALAAHFDRIGHYEAAATIIGFAATTFALAVFPENTARSRTFEKCSVTTSMRPWPMPAET